MALSQQILSLNLSEVADDNKFVTSENLGGAGDFTLTATLTNAQARKVLLTCVGNESARTFTIVGTNRDGTTITEAMPGNNATTSNSVLDFKTIVSITSDAATANDNEFGTSAVASTRWLPLINPWQGPFSIGVIATLVGTATYTVEVTNHHTALAETDANIRFIGNVDFASTKSAAFETNQVSPVKGIRASFTSTDSPITDATLTLDILQGGTG